MTASPWPDQIRHAWRPLEKIRPSQWAAANRKLTRRQSSRPGQWDNANAPCLVGIMDLCVRETVNELWICKAAQVGVSEAVRNVIGFFAQREPDPLLLVLPNEEVGKKIVTKRLI